LVSPVERKTKTVGVREQGAEENIWNQDGGTDMRMETIT
jgi:hypothetical protein